MSSTGLVVVLTGDTRCSFLLGAILPPDGSLLQSSDPALPPWGTGKDLPNSDSRSIGPRNVNDDTVTRLIDVCGAYRGCCN